MVQAFEWLCGRTPNWSCSPSSIRERDCILGARERTYDQETLVTGRLAGDAFVVNGDLLELGVVPGGMIICPRCASRRVVLLTFPDDEHVRPKEAPRPIARCADCAHRLTPQEITNQEKPSPN